LSGISYRAFAEGLEDNPGLTSMGWLTVAEENRLAREGNFGLGAKLGIFSSEADRRRCAMEQRFGRIVDATLVRESIVADDDSRWKVSRLPAI
jgi:hypothetical protein